MSHSNISEKTRTLIVKTGYLLQGAINHERGLPLDNETKVKYVDIQRKIGGNHFENHNNMLDIKCIRLWWKRRTDLEETGALNHRPRSGRPPHPAFATEEKKQDTFYFL